MRKVIELQMKLDEISIKDIEFDLKSRDEITKLLIGIQSIYCDKETRDQAFKVLVDLIPDNVDQNNGRRGMDFWKIFVLGMLRLNCNIRATDLCFCGIATLLWILFTKPSVIMSNTGECYKLAPYQPL